MNKITNIMERLGCSADFQLLSSEEKTHVIQSEFNLEQGNNIIVVLEQALNARQNVVCGIFPAEEPGKEQPDDDSDDDGSETENRAVANG